MRWLPSTLARYLLLGMVFVAVLAMLDELSKAVSDYAGLGLAVNLWACIAVVYGWLLIEPLVDSAMVLRKVDDPVVLAKIGDITRRLAEDNNMRAPGLCVFKSDTFDVMTVGIGRATTIFVSDFAASVGDVELRAILSHELGHVRLRHAEVRLALYGSLLTLAMMSTNLPMVPMIANLFVLWVMRKMEFAADAAGVEMVGSDAMKKALLVVGGSLGDVPRWQTLFSTHPRFSERINRLF